MCSMGYILKNAYFNQIIEFTVPHLAAGNMSLYILLFIYLLSTIYLSMCNGNVLLFSTFFFCLFLFWPCGLQDLSFPTRDQIHALDSESMFS